MFYTNFRFQSLSHPLDLGPSFIICPLFRLWIFVFDRILFRERGRPKTL
jgi:hypothetical protein